MPTLSEQLTAALTPIVTAAEKQIADAVDEAVKLRERLRIADLALVELSGAKAERDLQRKRADYLQGELDKVKPPAQAPAQGGGGSPGAPGTTLNPAGEKLTKPRDLGGKRVDLLKGARIELAEGAVLSNGTLATKPGDESVSITGDGAILEGITFDDNGGFLVKIGAEDVIVRNVTAKTFAAYGVYVEESQNVLLEDITINGGAQGQSNFRSSRSSGTRRRCKFVYTTPARRANIRGEGVWTDDNCWYEGAVYGPNPMPGRDGGEGYLVDRTVEGEVANPNETRPLMMAKAKTERDEWKLAVYFRSIAKVWNDNKDKSKGMKPASYSDDTLRKTLAVRKRELSLRSEVKVINRTTIKDVIELQAGTVIEFDGTNTIDRGDNAVFQSVLLTYPSADSAFQFDEPRPTPIMRGRGDIVNAKGGWGVKDDIAKQVLRGWFIVNGVRQDFAA